MVGIVYCKFKIVPPPNLDLMRRDLAVGGDKLQILPDCKLQVTEYYMTQNSKTQKGLTLIELIIALGVFSMAILVSVSIFISTLKVQRRVLASQSGIDSFRYAIEIISKEVRMAKKDLGACGHSGYVYFVPVSQDQVSFVNIEDECVRYALTEGRLVKYMSGQDGFSLGEMPVTSEDVFISKIKFLSSEAREGVGSGIQPRITMAVTFQPKTGASTTAGEVNIETTISSRFYE